MLLTTNQMLEQWRMRRFRHCLPSGDTTSEAYIDDFSTEKVEKAMVDDWYEHLLRTAPAEMLIGRNIVNTESFSIKIDSDGRRAIIVLPEGCVRILSVAYTDSGEPIELVEKDSSCARLASKAAFAMFARENSIATVVSQNRMMVYGESLSEETLEIIGVMKPADGFYELEPLALTTIDFDESTQTVII